MSQARMESGVIDVATLSEERIAHYRENQEICKNRSDIAALSNKLSKQKEIAKHPAEISLPVILQILLEIQSKLLECQQQKIVTGDLIGAHLLVDKAIKIFGETDRVQRGSLGDKKAYIKDILDKAKKTKKHPFIELENLVNDVAQVEITENTKALWEEMAIWMEGLYKRTADKISERDANNEPKKNAKGYYPTVDAEDYAIYLFLSITKMDISINYHRASVKLEEKVKLFQAGRKQSLAAIERAKASPLASSGKLEAVSSGMENSISHQVVVNDRSNGKMGITIQIELNNDDAEYGQLICDVLEDMCNNPLATELRKVAHLKDELRIEELLVKLENPSFAFSEIQKNDFANFRQKAITILTKYMDPKTLGTFNIQRFFGTPLPFVGGLLNKVNYEYAEFALSDLNSLDKKDDLKDQIIVMIKLLAKLVGNESTHLAPEVTNLLIDFSDRICAQSGLLEKQRTNAQSKNQQVSISRKLA